MSQIAYAQFAPYLCRNLRDHAILNPQSLFTTCLLPVRKIGTLLVGNEQINMDIVLIDEHGEWDHMKPVDRDFTGCCFLGNVRERKPTQKEDI